MGRLPPPPPPREFTTVLLGPDGKRLRISYTAEPRPEQESVDELWERYKATRPPELIESDD